MKELFLHIKTHWCWFEVTGNVARIVISSGSALEKRLLFLNPGLKSRGRLIRVALQLVRISVQLLLMKDRSSFPWQIPSIGK